MKAAFRVEVDGSRDVTRAIAERLRKLSVTDAVGISSDTARIEIDAESSLGLPRRGAQLSIAMGWEGAVRDMGTYAVDGLRLSHPPTRMEIRATAADLRGPLKQRRTASWDDATLGDVLGDTASAAGLGARVAPDLARVRIAHLDQQAESGLQLLARLGERHDFAWRVWGGRLAAIPLSGGSSASGDSAEVVRISAPVQAWRLRITDRPLYESVIAKWRDSEEAETMTERAGSGEPAYELRWHLASRVEAAEAAASRLASLRREAEALDVTPGSADPRIRALATLDVAGLHADVDGSWTCSRAVHAIDAGGGYSVSTEAYRAARAGISESF